jgi:ribonucleoside-diphosphate reductase alpha chain
MKTPGLFTLQRTIRIKCEMINVTKRDGSREPLNIDKIHKVVTWACEGLSGVSVSELELKSQVQFYDKIKTSDIHETLVKAASELISEDTPNYQYVAGRLINYQLRKEVYGFYEPEPLLKHYIKVRDQGYYDRELGNAYTVEEFDELESYINHDRDDLLTYAAMEQFRGKYLIKNRVTGQIYETPQMAFMLIAMTLFCNYPTHTRIQWVKDLYDALSTFDISLPTPIMSGVRSPQRQFSSCVLIETDDSLDSINATSAAIVKYVSQKAGIGIGAGKIRAQGSAIRNGDASHTGVIPFYKHFQTAVKSCSQGGVRGGAATLHYPLWHYEVEDLLVLKNNKGTEDNRIRHLDYSVQFNKVMYERLLSGGNITLFSPSDVPGLYDAFFTDVDKFRELYEKYERNTKIRKKTVPALELFSAFMQERKDTGRIYLQNVDHCNDHGSFIKQKAPVRMSNLCVAGDTWIIVQNAAGDIEDKMVREVLYDYDQYKVLCRDTRLGIDEFKTIRAAGLTDSNRKVVRITDDRGNVLVCTPDHKVYTKNRGYVEAMDLLPTDTLQHVE